jgi:hypothetical protein
MNDHLWTPPKPPPSGSGRLMFVQCKPEDEDKLQPAFSALGDLGIVCFTPFFEVPDEEREQSNAECLAAADATLIYWGGYKDVEIRQLCSKTLQLGGDEVQTKRLFVGIDPPYARERWWRGYTPKFKRIEFPTRAGSINEEAMKAIFL